MSHEFEHEESGMDEKKNISYENHYYLNETMYVSKLSDGEPAEPRRMSLLEDLDSMSPLESLIMFWMILVLIAIGGAVWDWLF